MHAAGENAAAFRAEPGYRFRVAQPVPAAWDSSGGRLPRAGPGWRSRTQQGADRNAAGPPPGGTAAIVAAGLNAPWPRAVQPSFGTSRSPAALRGPGRSWRFLAAVAISIV